ncbi:hypothetical protein [Motilimonas pumila]|uniref:Porin n=1 Tax=Motilimonas pumila TaxID=2303987 RepID=A0A418YAR6_9GAMM|nr:hypothetical protein [Motilimonas pumila]RJG40055.1 hypothetical protein D1Z90_17465 [Motilimonas pumila]
MQRTLLAASIALFSANVLASEVYLDANYKSHDVGAIKLGSDFGFTGLDLSAEVQTVKGNYDKTELEAAYQFNITENWYVTPSVNYVFNKSMQIKGANITDYGVMPFVDGNAQWVGMGAWATATQYDLTRTNVAKFGLKTGYQFNNGLFASARFRHEIGGAQLKVNSTTHTAHLARGSKDEIVPVAQGSYQLSSNKELKTNRWDLTLGYDAKDIAPLVAQYNYVHKNFSGPIKGSDKSHEMKLVYTGFGDAQPYVEYTANESRDNEFKAGLRYTF